MEHSPAMDARIAELAGKLDTHNSRITSCHVIVDQVDRHRAKGNQFEVHIVVHMPGRGEIVATRRSHEDPYLAVNEAFDSVMREVEKELELQRGDVKRHNDGREDSARP